MKKQVLILNYIVVMLLLFGVTNVSGYSFMYTDGADDVTIYVTMINIATFPPTDFTTMKFVGDYADEIDILSIELLENDTIIIAFQDQPLDNGTHSYKMNIYWDGDASSATYTHDAEFSDGVNHVGYNTPTESDDATGVISVIGNNLTFPITVPENLPNPNNPDLLIVKTSHGDASDSLRVGISAAGSGYTLIIGVFSISLMTIVIVIIRRNRRKVPS